MKIVWRPQVFAAIIVLGIITIISLLLGYDTVASTCSGGIIALGTQLVEKKEQ